MQQEPLFYLAPFQGITTAVFREVYTRHFEGIDKMFTAFFSSVQQEKLSPAKKVDLEQLQHNGITVVPQILSKDDDEILRFAKICAEGGFNEINWNLGCPFPRVAHKKRGSGLLPYSQTIREILDKIMPALPVKLSIKCRLGYHSTDEFSALVPVFNEYPIDELIVHARLGKQMYKGPVNWSVFKQHIEQINRPLVYNGDLFSPADFDFFKTRFQSVHRWMLGRGLLADPFLPAQLKGLELPQNTTPILYHFMNDLYLAYRKKMNDRYQAINVMKEMWSYLALSFDNPGKVFGKIKKCKHFDDYEDGVKSIFDQHVWVGNGGKKLLEQ